VVRVSAGYLAKCGRKKRHPDQARAEKHRQNLIRAGIWRAASSNTYFCNQCGNWHAGRIKGAPRGKGRKTAKNTPRFLASQ
jgi:rubrerythrin